MNKYWINQGAPNKDFWAHEVCSLVSLYEVHGSHQCSSFRSTLLVLQHSILLALQTTGSTKTSSTSSKQLSEPSLSSRPSISLRCMLSVIFCDEFIELMIISSAGIVPSNTTTYTLAQLQNAVKAQTGAIPFFGCGGTGAGGSAGRNILNEAWHFNHVLGTEQYGHFKPIDSTTPSTCSPTGIRYLERTPSSEREVRVIP